MSERERHELIEPLERVLAVVSHPDDAEFLAGSTIALLTAAGARVDYVVTTDGARGTEDPDVTPEHLSATRRAEQRAAADILGVTDIVHLDYPDGYLQPTLDLRRDITRQIRRFRPDLVITQNPQRRLDFNLWIAAWRASGCSLRERGDGGEGLARFAPAVGGAEGAVDETKPSAPSGGASSAKGKDADVHAARMHCAKGGRLTAREARMVRVSERWYWEEK